MLKQGHPYMTLGTPGGDSQPQSCLQVFTNIVDFGLNVQEAVEAPGSVAPASPVPWPHRAYPNRLQVEGTPRAGGNRGAQRQRSPGRGRRAMGCQERLYPYSRGTRDGGYYGGADPRKESVMLGW